jgi:prepilin-type N-terminal cleavage/methylation domain-containing protein
MKNVKSFSRGFTMIELLVVIAIIGILAAVLVPVVSHMFGMGDEADAREDLRRLGRAALTYKTEHEGHYPAAGGYIYTFRDYSRGDDEYYGRAVGWVNFQHNCATYCVDGVRREDYLGDGSADWGNETENICVWTVNERGHCLCFKANQTDGGINPQPAAWSDKSAETGLTEPQGAIRSGAIFEHVGSMESYVNPNFAAVAVEKGHAKSEKHVVRSYAMNIIAGTDEDIYNHNIELYDDSGEMRRGTYQGPVQWGAKNLVARVSGDGEGDSERAVAEPGRTILFAELDLDSIDGSELNGDQVWDWDGGNESIGFNFDDSGQKFALVCFADGRVERINDPSSNSDHPDKNKRQKLSKWYGSGGVCADGEKLD